MKYSKNIYFLLLGAFLTYVGSVLVQNQIEKRDDEKYAKRNPIQIEEYSFTQNIILDTSSIKIKDSNVNEIPINEGKPVLDIDMPCTLESTFSIQNKSDRIININFIASCQSIEGIWYFSQLKYLPAIESIFANSIEPKQLSMDGNLSEHFEVQFIKPPHTCIIHYQYFFIVSDELNSYRLFIFTRLYEYNSVLPFKVYEINKRKFLSIKYNEMYQYVGTKPMKSELLEPIAVKEFLDSL